MDVKGFIASVGRLMKVTNRPSRREALALIKISLLGVATLGAVGFAVKALFMIVGLAP